jgi:N-acetylmuramoyl-L-alanine amidase
LPKPADTVKLVDIQSIVTLSEGDLVLQPGDKIKFKVKGLPGCIVKTLNETMLYEIPVSQAKGMAGIYSG